MRLDTPSHLLVCVPWLEGGRGTGRGGSTLSLGVRLICVQTQGKKACVEVLTWPWTCSPRASGKAGSLLDHPVSGWGGTCCLLLCVEIVTYSALSSSLGHVPAYL